MRNTYLLPFLFLAGCSDKPAPVPTEKEKPAIKEKEKETVKAEVWPTEAEVKATVQKVEQGIYASEHNKSLWKVKDVQHEFKEVKMGQRTIRKQMSVGGQLETCYPVKVIYTRTTNYEHKAPVKEESGPDKTAFFYRDSFGDWTCKFGSE